MAWTTDDYPASMKNLPDETREKAIEIANRLLKDGYKEGEAIPIAISQAKSWAENNPSSPGNDDIRVLPHEDGWAVQRDGNDRASKVTDTKAGAKAYAMDLAGKDSVNIIIHYADGKIQEYMRSTSQD